MSHNIAEKTRVAQKRGTGHGADYKPWIYVYELPGHSGIHHNLIDWKHGRQTHLLSSGELWQYLITRWDDNVIDIREQFPLDLEVTKELFGQYKNFKHPCDKNGLRRMTSDLLVDYKDGHQAVFSVKYSRKLLLEKTKHTESMIKKLWIEKQYWQGRDVEWNLVFTDEMNRILAENISEIVYYWNPETVTDKVSLLKHLIARKKISIDLESHPVVPAEYSFLADKYISDDMLAQYP